MNKALAVFLLIFFGVAGAAFADVSIEGSNDRLNYSGWLPKRVYIAFHYNDQGKLSGYRVAFQADGGELFNEWRLKKANEDSMIFPFVLESTLVIDNKNEVEKLDFWGFGRLDGVNDSIPEAYLDSTAYDFWSGTDKYGIGIVNPHELQGDVVYDYWVALSEASFWFVADPSTLDVQLRFRLNIDLSSAKKFGYEKSEIESDFELGIGWKGGPGDEFGYDNVDVSENYTAQEIGKFFSFAIGSRTGSDLLPYSSYLVLDGMTGQWCKGRDDSEVTSVNSIEECFGVTDNSNSGISSLDDLEDPAASGSSPYLSASVVDPEETSEPTKPNFEGVGTKLKTLSGQEKYVWCKSEDMYMHLWFQNDGDADWKGDHDYVEVRYYLSKGIKEDLHSEWERVGIDTIQKYNLEMGDDPHHEDDRLILLNKDSIQPGNYYNIVGCIDRTVDQNNGEGDVDEIHESDNCIKEKVFYVSEESVPSSSAASAAIINFILD
ncbi:hypothetical protein ACFL08_05480 [Patescibacteria group bacterium]